MRYLFLLLVVLLAVSGCTNKPSDSGNGKITKGEKEQLAQVSLSTSETTIKVDKPGSPVNGLTIDVPAESYKEDGKLTITATEIVSHDLGQYINPLTPLITISDSHHTDSIMRVTIPVKVPAGHFAMAFFYDERTGQLEAATMVDHGESAVSFVVNGFDHSEAPAEKGIAGQYQRLLKTVMSQIDPGIPVEIGFTQIIVSSVDEKELRKTHTSGFSPGVDDWRIPPSPTRLATRGTLAGKTVGSLWYYFNQKASMGNLYEALDNHSAEPTPKVWEDDQTAIRFCSLLHMDSESPSEYTPLRLWQQKYDFRVMYSFAYALIATKAPQLAYVRNRQGSGSLLIAYAIEDGTLHIADPRYPGDMTRRIHFDPVNKTYSPYQAGRFAGDEGEYNKVFYLARSHVSSWKTAEKRWKEVIARTQIPAFPHVSVFALNKDNEWVNADGILDEDGKLTLKVEAGNLENVKFKIYRPDGSVVSSEGDVQLGSGNHSLGFAVFDEYGRWTGFRWIIVQVPKNEQAQKGDIIVEVDGGPYMGPVFITETATFEIADNVLEIIAANPQTKESILLRIHNFKGEGSYQFVEGLLTTTVRDPKGDFKSLKDENCTLTILHWKEDLLEGEFKVEYFLAGDKKYADKRMNYLTIRGTFTTDRTRVDWDRFQK